MNTLTLNTASLRAALAIAKTAMARKSNTPILANVLIVTTSTTSVFVKATDMETEIVLPVEHVGALASLGATVPHHALAAMLAGSKVETVTLAIDGTACRVTLGDAVATLACLPVIDFPAITKGALAWRARLPAAQVRDMFDVPQHAISTEKLRYYLNGIMMHVDTEGRLVTVATDGHRLVRMVTDAGSIADRCPRVIIPAAAIVSILKALPKTGAVWMTWSDTRIRVDLPDGGIILAKLIDATYPEYERVIPRDNAIIVTMMAADLAACVKRVAAAGGGRERSAPVRLDFEPAGTVTITAKNGDGLVASETLACSVSGGPFSIGFQARYLRAALAHCGTVARLAFGYARTAAVFTDAGRSDRTLVLMPMGV